jgi:hypothetical protein
MGKCTMTIALMASLINLAFAPDRGRYTNDPLKYWFDNLTSSNGRCCSFADGVSVGEVEWDSDDGHYRVRLHGQWVNVPNSSVVTEPNRYVVQRSCGPTWIRTATSTFDVSCQEQVHNPVRQQRPRDCLNQDDLPGHVALIALV